MVRVKICGITCLEDALAAVRHGTDALGFVFAPSVRQVTPEAARSIIGRLPALVTIVGVFVDAPPGWIMEVRRFCGLDAIQLHGDETEETVRLLRPRVIKVVHPEGNGSVQYDGYAGATLLLDALTPEARGGTGRTFDWNLAVETARKRRIILAGGLTPDNVLHAVRKVQPYGVDVSSGVEMEPGRKDHAKIESFIRRAKSLEIGS